MEKEFMPYIENIRVRRFLAIAKRDFIGYFIIGTICFIMGYSLPFILASIFT